MSHYIPSGSRDEYVNYSAGMLQCYMNENAILHKTIELFENEKNGLGGQITSLKRDNSVLQFELDKLKLQRDQEISHNVNLESKNEKLKKEMSDLKVNLSQSRKNCDYYEGRNEETKKELRALKKKFQDYEDEMSSFQAQKVDYSNELIAQLQRRADLETEEAALNKKLQKLCNTRDKLARETDDLTDQVHFIKKEKNRLEDELSSLESQVIDYKNDYNYCKIDILQKEIEELKALLDKQREKFESEKRSLQSRKDLQLAAAQRDLKEAMKKFKSPSQSDVKEKGMLKKQKEELESAVIDLKKELNDAKKSLVDLNQELGAKIAELTSNLKDAEGAVAELVQIEAEREKLLGCDIENAVLRKQNESLQSQNDSLKRQNMDSTTEITTLKDKVQQLESEIGTVMQQRKRTRRVCLKLKIIKEKYEVERNSLKEKNEALQLQAETLENKQNDCIEKSEMLKNRVMDCETELACQKEIANNLKQGNSKLNQQIKEVIAENFSLRKRKRNNNEVESMDLSKHKQTTGINQMGNDDGEIDKLRLALKQEQSTVSERQREIASLTAQLKESECKFQYMSCCADENAVLKDEIKELRERLANNPVENSTSLKRVRSVNDDNTSAKRFAADPTSSNIKLERSQ